MRHLEDHHADRGLAGKLGIGRALRSSELIAEGDKDGRLDTDLLVCPRLQLLDELSALHLESTKRQAPQRIDHDLVRRDRKGGACLYLGVARPVERQVQSVDAPAEKA
jgi:hypothetical protein